MKTDISDLRQKILEEARSRIATPPADDEITASMLADDLDCSERQARVILQDLVDEGKATVRDNGLMGAKVYLYKE